MDSSCVDIEPGFLNSQYIKLLAGCHYYVENPGVVLLGLSEKKPPVTKTCMYSSWRRELITSGLSKLWGKSATENTDSINHIRRCRFNQGKSGVASQNAINSLLHHHC